MTGQRGDPGTVEGRLSSPRTNPGLEVFSRAVNGITMSVSFSWKLGPKQARLDLLERDKTAISDTVFLVRSIIESDELGDMVDNLSSKIFGPIYLHISG